MECVDCRYMWALSTLCEAKITYHDVQARAEFWLDDTSSITELFHYEMHWKS